MQQEPKNQPLENPNNEPVDEKPRDTFTAKDRVEAMVKKNPAVATMIEKFNLLITL